jgi:hypothetical protein
MRRFFKLLGLASFTILVGAALAQTVQPGGMVSKFTFECVTRKTLSSGNLQMERPCYIRSNYFSRSPIDNVSVVYTVKVGELKTSYRTTLHFRQESFFDWPNFQKAGTLDKYAIGTQGFLFLEFDHPWTAFMNAAEVSPKILDLIKKRVDGTMDERFADPYSASTNQWPLGVDPLLVSEIQASYQINYAQAAPVRLRVVWK